MKTLINLVAILLFISAANLVAQETDYSKYAGFANFGDLEALEDGEMVVTAGISKLTEGLRVKLLQ